eukprot:CAMPEP_0170597092 /NCGR_PEP_ID=MMETSP0224-20130122/15516_1 /TAXON_ID=285029 /ORGANISM="Togula jolla, Strain CCCM 725" /LENGTH=1058 /DNA_ID=CAMNT_0010921527 /DNA_START=24 /DNA_END=3200 /DNA_ORIENTATION=-
MSVLLIILQCYFVKLVSSALSSTQGLTFSAASPWNDSLCLLQHDVRVELRSEAKRIVAQGVHKNSLAKHGADQHPVAASASKFRGSQSHLGIASVQQVERLEKPSPAEGARAPRQGPEEKQDEARALHHGLVEEKKKEQDEAIELHNGLVEEREEQDEARELHHGLVEEKEKGQDEARELHDSLVEEVDEGRAAGHSLAEEEAIAPLTGKKPQTGFHGFFRRVSVTVTCVMILTFMSLWQYVSLAVRRTLDDFSNLNKPSFAVEVLTAAARSIVYPPMICCLFVACRMHVLATTDGKLEPQPWVKGAMLVTTAGMVLQYINVAVLLPLLAESQTWPDGSIRPFTEVTGGALDVHPRIRRHKFSSEFQKILLGVLQGFAWCCIYGGVGTVMYGMYSFRRGNPDQEEPSPAFECSAALTFIYMLVRVSVWFATARSRQGTVKAVNAQGAFQSAALSAVFAVQKAPMLSLLFLTARLRAMQLDPWNGKPQLWARQFFFLATGTVLCEAIVAAIIGATGKEETGYYGAHIYKSSYRAIHLLQHAFNAVTAVALWMVYLSILTQKTPDGGRMKFPPTLHCIILLSGVYFVVHGVLYTSFLLKHVFNWHSKLLQDSALAANVSVNFCPMLCVLFLASRLRAVQLTDFTGGPQTWAQDTMYLCTFAAIIQAAACVVMPALTENKSGFDDDGNATYDLGPMMGASVVTAIKYFVLLLLFGCMVIICYSICVLTPTTANYGTHDKLFTTVEHWSWAILALMAAMLLSSAKVVGHAIKLAVESVNVGVKISVDKAAVSLWHGYVNLEGVRVGNPKPRKGGQKFTSPHLLKVDSVVIQMSLGQVITTRGKLIEIQVVAMKGVQVILEKGSCVQESNIALANKYLKGEDNPSPLEKLKDCTEGIVGKSVGNSGCGSMLPSLPSWPSSWKMKSLRTPSCSDLPSWRSCSTESCGPAEPEPAEEDGGRCVILRTLDVRAVGAEIVHAGSTALKVKVGDLKTRDFKEEPLRPSDIVVLILGTLFKTLLTNTDLVGNGLWTVLTVPCPQYRRKSKAERNEDPLHAGDINVGHVG